MFAIPFFVDEPLGSSTNARRRNPKGKPAMVDSTSPSFQFDVSALESLSAAITRLKAASGVLPSDELWHRVELDPPTNGSASDRMRWIETSKDYVKDLARIAATLSQLYRNVQHLQLHVKTQISSHSGIGRLPDELLLHIFSLIDPNERIYDRTGVLHTKDLHKLTKVCSRFRDVIVSQASPWVVLSNELWGHELEELLALSGNTELTISVCYREGDFSGCAAFLERVSHVSHRWRSLTVDFWDTPEWEMHELSDVFEHLQYLRLPALRSFKYSIPHAAKHELEYLHFYTEWSAPNLQNVVVNEIIPRKLGFPLPPLRSCTMTFRIYGTRRIRDDEKKLLDFLESQPLLEELEVRPDVLFRGRKTPNTSRVLSMPSLQKLILRNAHYVSTDGADEDQFSPYGIFFILNSLKTPSIKSMSLEFRIMDTDFSLDAIFPGINSYDTLEDLRISLNDYDIDVSLSPFQSIFRHARSLKRLSLETYDVPLSVVFPHDVVPPPLQLLHFQNCRSMTLEDIMSMVRDLQRGPHWEQFQVMELVQMWHIREDDLVAALEQLSGSHKVHKNDLAEHMFEMY